MLRDRLISSHACSIYSRFINLCSLSPPPPFREHKSHKFCTVVETLNHENMKVKATNCELPPSVRSLCIVPLLGLWNPLRIQQKKNMDLLGTDSANNSYTIYKINWSILLPTRRAIVLCHNSYKTLFTAVARLLSLKDETNKQWSLWILFGILWLVNKGRCCKSPTRKPSVWD